MSYTWTMNNVSFFLPQPVYNMAFNHSKTLRIALLFYVIFKQMYFTEPSYYYIIDWLID